MNPDNDPAKASARPERKLAAILAADVVGYSGLMWRDEEGTHGRLRELLRDVVEPSVDRYRGRIVKTTGDGLIAEFASAVNAVQCAVDIQHGMTAANSELPEAHRMVLRIGVNLGDVIVEGGDLYGDGVNIAARLESISEPGGIVVSGTAFDHVRNKVDADFEDLGAQTLKNIAEAVRAYRVTGTRRLSVIPPKGATDKPSIAVLPFANMSGDPEQRYFSDGITEDILTELSRFRSLTVIARNSSFRFRGSDVDVVRVGRELGVQYVLEGSVRKMGDKICITAQLIDADTGSHIWAERFDRKQEEIFAVQDKVVSTIVGTLAGRLHAVGAERAGRKPPASLAAYDCVLRADALPSGDRKAQAEARRWSEKAVELDPSYGRGYTQLAISYGEEWMLDYSGSDSALDQAYLLARKAITLDDNDSTAYSVLGWIHSMRRTYELAEHCFEKAIALNPNSPHRMINLGDLYGYLGRPEEGIECYNQAKLIDQYFDPTWYWPGLGVLHFIAGRYDEAIANLSRSPTMPDAVHSYLAACYALTGRSEQAALHAAEALNLAPDFSSARFVAKEPFKQLRDRDRLLEGLRRAGLPE